MTNAQQDGRETPTVDARTFLRFAQACAECRTEQSFRELVVECVRPMLPHGLLAAVVGRVDIEHLQIVRFVGVDYPESFQRLLPMTLNIRERPVFQRWLMSREPQVLSLPDDEPLMSTRERAEIETFGLGRLAIHGVVDLASRTGTYFSFGRVSESVPANQVTAKLRVLAPLLSQALMSIHRCNPRSAPDASDALSATERDLLRWVIAGRTNAEIAQLRGRSVATIRNQLHSAFGKLGVANRVEAARVVLHGNE